MRGGALASLLLLLSCGADGPTEIVLVVDTDLLVPDELDRIEISLSGSSGARTNVAADLADPSTPSLPLTLTAFAAPGGGRLEVTVVGLSMGSEVTRWEARTRFVDGETRMLRAILAARCLGIACGDGETCDQAGCREVSVDGDALPEWPGSPPVVDGPACEPSEEQCNLYDDDCDETIDEGIDVSTDPANCGECGRACPGAESCGGGFCDSERATDIAAGGAHACVVRQSGGVACWGWNAYGQLGDGTVIDRPLPRDVAGLSGATDVSAGVAHTCAVAGGDVHCWGENRSGELGDGTTTPRFVPAPVGLSGAVAVSAGVAHTCAITEVGDVACWGSNARGQIGNGTTDDALTPQTVVVGDPVASVATGNVHTCAAFADGRVECWGANGGGQLGTTAPGPDQPLPTMVAGAAGAARVTAGRGHSCLLAMDGTAACWGSNDRGQLGNGLADPSYVAVMVAGLSGASSISTSAAGSHVCVATTSGASCWGANAFGQLGDGTTTDASMPVSMSGVDVPPADVAVGGSGASGAGFTCVLETSGAVRCVGDGGLGQLGQGFFDSAEDAFVHVRLRR